MNPVTMIKDISDNPKKLRLTFRDKSKKYIYPNSNINLFGIDKKDLFKSVDFINKKYGREIRWTQHP